MALHYKAFTRSKAIQEQDWDMILESLACGDFSRKPTAKKKQKGKKKGKAGKSAKKVKPAKVGKSSKKDKPAKTDKSAKAGLGNGYAKAMKMDAKNVHSRAYHKGYHVAKKAGKTSADCRTAGQESAKLAVSNM